MAIEKVLKFGGTSVGSPQRMKALVALISKPEPSIVVLSAVAGTTNSLVAIAAELAKGNKELALTLTDELQNKYKPFVDELFTSQNGKQAAQELIQTHFKFIRSFTEAVFTILEERSILAQGELLSTAIFQLYLSELGIESVLLPALDFMRIDEEKEPDTAYISTHLKRVLEQFTHQKLFITQGFICRNAFGEIDNLKRGGSDYTASLIGAAITVNEVQIWTDIDGMHNNDPRIVDKTYPVSELSFDEAAELAYFGAKILHPSSVLPAQKFNIPVRLLNTMQPEAKGTLISAQSTPGIKAAAAKDGITVINIKSSRMLLAYGFLKKVFEVFERFKTPIDMITTSEVSISLTIDDSTHLTAIVEELTEYAQVEVDSNQSIVCIVGDLLADKPGYAAKLFSALEEIPIRMISYGGSANNISMVVSTNHKVAALQAINDHIFFESK